jgi:hypothetical protein
VFKKSLAVFAIVSIGFVFGFGAASLKSDPVATSAVQAEKCCCGCVASECECCQSCCCKKK